MDSVSAAPRAPKGRTACDLCRLRKVRCDRGQPACENCHIAGLPCTFTPPAPQQRKSLRQELAEAQARVQELERVLDGGTKPTPPRTDDDEQSKTSTPGHQSISSASPQSRQVSSSYLETNYIPDTRSLDAALAAFQSHLAYCGLGSRLSTARANFCATVYQQSGHAFDLDDFFNETAAAFEKQGFTSKRKTITLKWPSPSLVKRCVEYYAQCGLYSMFPFADSEALQMLVNADVLNQPNTTRATNRACLAAFTANITIMHRHDPAFCGADPYAYAQAALSLVPELLMEAPDLRTLETIMMLVVFISPLGQPVSAELLLGIAIQVLYNLGGHKIRPTPETPGRSQQSQHLRALFWLCYGIDSEFSIRKGQPPLLSEVHCDLDLPFNYTLKSSEHHFYWKPLSSKELLYPSDLRLNLIKSKIYKLLYSEKNASHSEARRIQLIRELDHELSALRSEFPVDCRPDLFATENAPDYLFHDLSIRGVSIHLEYYYCLGKIHGANNTYNIPASKSWSPLSSSAEICYEAARSTLIYIGRVQHYINYHTFWIHAQFVLTAVLTLFRFIITAPAAPSFTRDLKILDDTANLFAEFTQSDDPERNCFPPFFLAHAFIKKLVFLAKESHIRSIAM